ncbi:hypothetical protein GTO89_04950 [Heliobacterium gestii]|uniref:Uncharacterized protein n=1 Tax=Heliomicrobium gestii TaxID=2699 RepID=A0A845LCL6_HELGE|nr:hypothetical protein [Heliomicrobium gestii]MBM7866966.1 hypothetical protein [Heliomicrobium gestii]MZP42389.1 hypothetical protein [Heliomicrobium gestii]
MRKPVLSDYGLTKDEIPEIEKKHKNRKWMEAAVTFVPLGLIYAVFSSGVIPNEWLLMVVPLGFAAGAGIAIGGKYFFNKWYMQTYNPKIEAFARYKVDTNAYQSKGE